MGKIIYTDRKPTKTSPKLTEDSFDTIQGDTGERIKERIIYRHRRSQIQGWLDRVRPDGRLSACANTCGTNTGRMTHSNVANVPKAIEKVPYGIAMRELFCAPQGYVLVGVDAAQLELRIMAHYMGDEAYIEAVSHDDIHVHNQNLAGLPDRGWTFTCSAPKSFFALSMARFSTMSTNSQPLYHLRPG